MKPVRLTSISSSILTQKDTTEKELITKDDAELNSCPSTDSVNVCGIPFYTAIIEGYVNLDSGLFHDKVSDKICTINDAIRRQLLQPFSIFENINDKYSLSHTFLHLFDVTTEKFIIPDTQAPVSFEFLVKNGCINTNSLLYIINGRAVLTLKDALKENIIDLKTGSYVDTSSRELINMKQAAKLGYIAVIDALVLPTSSYSCGSSKVDSVSRKTVLHRPTSLPLDSNIVDQNVPVSDNVSSGMKKMDESRGKKISQSNRMKASNNDSKVLKDSIETYSPKLLEMDCGSPVSDSDAPKTKIISTESSEIQNFSKGNVDDKSVIQKYPSRSKSPTKNKKEMQFGKTYEPNSKVDTSISKQYENIGPSLSSTESCIQVDPSNKNLSEKEESPSTSNEYVSKSVKFQSKAFVSSLTKMSSNVISSSNEEISTKTAEIFVSSSIDSIPVKSEREYTMHGSTEADMKNPSRKHEDIPVSKEKHFQQHSIIDYEKEVNRPLKRESEIIVMDRESVSPSAAEDSDNYETVHLSSTVNESETRIEFSKFSPDSDLSKEQYQVSYEKMHMQSPENEPALQTDGNVPKEIMSKLIATDTSEEDKPSSIKSSVVKSASSTTKMKSPLRDQTKSTVRKAKSPSRDQPLIRQNQPSSHREITLKKSKTLEEIESPPNESKSPCRKIEVHSPETDSTPKIEPSSNDINSETTVLPGETGSPMQMDNSPSEELQSNQIPLSIKELPMKSPLRETNESTLSIANIQVPSKVLPVGLSESPSKHVELPSKECKVPEKEPQKLSSPLITEVKSPEKEQNCLENLIKPQQVERKSPTTSDNKAKSPREIKFAEDSGESSLRGKRSPESSKSPSREIKLPQTESKSSKEIKSPKKGKKSPMREIISPGNESVGLARDSKSPEKEMQYQTREIKPSVKEINPPMSGNTFPERESKSPIRDIESTVDGSRSGIRDVESPQKVCKPTIKNIGSPMKENKSLLRESLDSPEKGNKSPDEFPEAERKSPVKRAKSPQKGSKSPGEFPEAESKSPVKRAKSPQKGSKSSIDVIGSLEKETRMLERDNKSPEKDIKSSKIESKLPDKDERSPVREIKSPRKETKPQIRDIKSSEKQSKSSITDIKSTDKDKSPVREIKSPGRETNSLIKDIKSEKESKSPIREIKSTDEDESPVRDIKSLDKGTESPARKNVSEKDINSSVRIDKSPEKYTKSLTGDIENLEKGTKLLTREVTSPEKSLLPVKEAKFPEKESKSPARKVVSTEKESKSPTRETASPERECIIPKRKIKSPEEDKAQIREIKSTETRLLKNETESLEKESKSLMATDAKSPERQNTAVISPEKLDKTMVRGIKSPERENKLPLKEAETLEKENISAREVGSLERESKSPTREIKSPERETKSPTSEIKSPERETKSPTREIKSPERETKSPAREIKSPERETKSPTREIKSPERETKSHTREIKSLKRETQSPIREIKSPERETKSPIREIKSPERETKSPTRESKSLTKEIKSIEREVKSPTREMKYPERENKSPTRKLKSPERESKSPVRETKSTGKESKLPKREIGTLENENKSATRKVKSPEKESESLTREDKLPSKNISLSEKSEKLSEREIRAPENLSKSPIKEIKSPGNQSKSPPKEIKSLENQCKSPTKLLESGIKFPPKDNKSATETQPSVKEIKFSEIKQDKSPSKEVKEAKTPSKKMKTPERETISPTREGKSPKESALVNPEYPFGDTKLPHKQSRPSPAEPIRESTSPTRNPKLGFKSSVSETEVQYRKTKERSAPGKGGNSPSVGIEPFEREAKIFESEIGSLSKTAPTTKNISKRTTKENEDHRNSPELPATIESSVKETKSQSPEHISIKETIIIDQNITSTALERDTVKKQSTSFAWDSQQTLEKVNENVTEGSPMHERIPLTNVSENFHYSSKNSFSMALFESQSTPETTERIIKPNERFDSKESKNVIGSTEFYEQKSSDFNFKEYYTEFTEEIVSSLPRVSAGEALSAGVVETDTCRIVINNKKMLLRKAIEENLISSDTNVSIISKNEVTLSDDQQVKMQVELNSAAVEENYKICEENTSKLEAWMKDIEDKLADIGVIEEHLPGLQLQMSTVKVLKEELESKQNLIITCLDQMRQLAQRGLEVLTKEEINYLQKNLISLRRHYDSLVNECDRLLKRLTSAFEELQKYKSEVKSLKEWLNTAQREFSITRSSMGALSKLESKYEHIRSFTSDVIAHQADLRFITMAAQKFIAESQDYLKALNTLRVNLPEKLPAIKASDSEIKSEVQEVTNVFRNFLNEVTRLSDNYTVICSKYRSYVEVAEKAKIWISDVKKSSRKIIDEPVADEPSAVQDQLDKIKLINMEVVGQGRTVENVYQAVKVLTDAADNYGIAPVELKDIENTLNKLQEDYAELINSIASRIKELQIALIHSQDIQGGMDRILKWLEETETAMKFHNKPVSLMPEKLDAQVQECKILKSDIENQKQSIDMLASSAKEISSDANPKLAKKVNTKFNDVSQRFDMLCKNISKRWTLLEEISSNVHAFQEMSLLLDEYFSATLERIESIDNVHRADIDGFSSIIEYTLNHRNSKKNDFEQLLKVGKTLVEKTDVSDKGEVKNKIRSLEEQWKNIGDLLNEKKQMGKARSEQLAAYDSLRVKILDWLLKMERDFEKFEPVALDQTVLKRQAKETQYLFKEHLEFSSTVEKIKDLGVTCESVMKFDGSKGKSSPVKKAPSPTRKSPSKSGSNENFSVSPVKNQVITQSPLSTVSSGFSSRRSSTDNVGVFDDITPIQQQLSEINDRYKMLGIKISDRNQEICSVTEEINSFYTVIKELTVFIEGKQKLLPKESVLLAKASIDSHVVNLKELQREVLEKQPDMDSLKMNILCTLSKRKAAKATDLQEELHNIEKKWNLLSSSIKQILTFLQDLKEFQDSQQVMQNWLAQKEKMFQVLGPIASEPRMVTSQVQQVQVMRDEFTSQKYLMDRLNELSMTLIVHLQNIGSSSVKISEQMDMIQQQWNAMSGRLIDREKSLEAASSIVKDFHKNLSELQGKVQNVSDKFDALEDKEMALEILLKKLSEIEEELDKQRPLLADAQSVCEQLCDVLTDSSSKTEIKYKISLIEKSYGNLKKKIDNKKAEVESSLKEDKTFFKVCEEISLWLKTTETSFAHSGPISADLSKILKEKENYESLYQEIMSKEHEVYLCLSKGSDMVNKLSGKQESSLKAKLDSIKKQFEKIKKNAIDRHTRLRSCYENCKKYQSSVDKFIPWLQDIEGRFSSIKPSDLRRESLNKQLKETQVLKSELSVHFQEYQNIQLVGEDILSSCETDKEATKKQLISLKNKWNGLNTDVGAKVLALEDLFQTILEFEENLRDIQHEVQRLEDKMCSHDSLGDVSCDPVLLDCLKVLLEEAVGMKSEISKLKKFVKVVVHKAGEGTDTTEILKSVDDIEKRYTTVTKNLETRCTTLSASYKIIAVYMEQMKSLRTELANLDEAFDNLRPIARDLASLKSQLKDLKDIRSNLSQTKKNYAALEKIYNDISKQEHISETKCYLEQVNSLSKQITRLEEHINEKETTIMSITTRIENFYSMYSETEKFIKSLLKKEEGFEASVGDVETIRKHQQKFKDFQSSEVIPLSKQIIEVNKIGQGLIQSTTSGVDTTDLEQKLEILNNSWNSLQELINEKEKKLDIALLQSGKFQEALSGVQKWLIDTEEMVSNQKAPSPDFKVCKAQIQEQKFLKKMLLDRQNSVMSLKAIRTEIVCNTKTTELEQAEILMENISHRFDELISTAEVRMTVLEKIIPLAQEFQIVSTPVVEWLENCEKKLFSMSSVPVEENKIKAMIVEHKKISSDIHHQKKPIEQLNSIYENVKTIATTTESDSLGQKLHTINEKFSEIKNTSENIGSLLIGAQKGIGQFCTTYTKIITFIEETSVQLVHFQVLSVYSDKLQNQLKELKKLKEKLNAEETNVHRVITSGEEIMKIASGEDSIQMKEKLDSLNIKVSEISNKINERLRTAEESLPLVETFYTAINRLSTWLDSLETSLKLLDSSTLDVQRESIKKMEESIPEYRSVLETINNTGPRLCQLAAGEGSVIIENQMSRANQRFEKASEQIQRKAERIQLSLQRKYDVISDMDELSEWFQETEKRVTEDEGLSSEPNVLIVLLKEQKSLCEELNGQKNRVRDVITTAKKLMRESSSEDLSYFHEKMEALKTYSNNVSIVCQEKLSALEQALPLAQHFFETHSDLGLWLDEVEGEAELLEAPALNSVQIKKQQDRNKDLTQSVQEHKPLVDKLNKTGSALTKLCKDDESSKLEVILESDNSRYNALRKILREHQNALEEALQATSQFSDKLEGILNALTSTADQLHNAEPISAHPDRIQEQINDNKAVLQDLDKRTLTLEAVKKAADDVIGKASTIDEPAVRDIKIKLDRLNDLWVTIQTAAHNRGKSLEEALVAAEKFWDELTAVMKALKELQINLNCQEPPAVEPAAVQQQQDVLQEIKQGITQTKPEVDHCRQAGQNLMQLCGEPDKPDVKKHIEDLDSVWENVTTLYAKREQNLVDAMEKAMVFHNTMQNLLEFLDTFEEKFSKFGAVSSDIDAVKSQINELKNFKSQVDPHMVEVEALNRQAQELMERTSSDQAISIREPLIDINQRWDDLLKSIVERQREMENTLLKLGQFQHALEEHLIWMTKTEKTLDELKPVLGDPQVIEVVLAKHKVISNDIQAHQSSIDAINRAGHEFVDSDRGSEDAKSTHNKLQNLQIRWQHLQNKSAERYRELEEALKEAQQFHQDIQDLLMWLNDIDGQLVTSKPVGGLPETAREQLNKFMDLYNELDTNRYKVENILQQGQNYLKKSGESNTKTLQHSLRTLKQRSDNVLNKANDRKIKLEIALREATEFHEALQQFVEWLTNAEKYLTGLKPVSRHMKAVLEQIEEHRNFQKDLSTHREVMLNLDKKGTHLKYFSQKQDVILIKNLLISVQHRWEKVVSKAAERTRALDHGYKEAKEFHDAWTSLSAWLDEAEKILDTTTPIGNDPLKIKKLLSKHKEFQRSLGSKQITYDATMKIGRILKDKCPKQDVQLIQDMVDELKVRWNKVCSKSVDKQRKLEEALLYSGQFKDAVLALMDWFDKAIASLSESKPYHGDLDTVTSLIEQHKSFEEALKNKGLSLESVCKTSVDLKKQASATDVESISTQVNELKTKWKTVSELSETKKRNLSQALQLAEKLYKMVHILLEWLSDAEMKLRFFGSLPEDEESTRKQISDHENFLSEMKDKENTKNDTLTLAQDILEKCHPDGISVIRHWITIIQSRWEEISTWAKQRDQRLRDHLLSLRDINSLLEELLAWLIKAESSLTELEAQPLPDDLPTLDELIKEHQVFMTDMSKRQTDVEKISKAFSAKRHQAKTLVPPLQTKEKAKDKSSRSGTPTPLKTSTPLRPQIDSDIKHPRARLLLEKWRIVWLLAMERQRRLQDRRNYLLELDRIKHFDFNDWRSRYLGWLNNKKSRIMDQFKKIDKNNHGKVTKQEFIDGILKSKFATSRLEMERVADIFDRNGDGFIDTKEYIETLRPEREDQPKTEAEKIQDEVQRQVSKCTCVHRFKVYQVGEGKYRFGDSQKLRLVRILRSTVMVRVGGGWVALDEFLVKNDPCRAKGRTNLELREQFILADGVSQSMAPFKPKPSPNSSVSSQSGTTNFMPSAGPITKIREKSERSTPMRQSRSSAENSSDISAPSFSETDSFSNRSGVSKSIPSRISPRTPSGKSSSRPSSRQGSRPPSRAPSDLSQDGVEDYKTNRKTITGNGVAQKVPVLGKAKSASESSKIPSVQKSTKQPLNRVTSRKIESREEK